MTIIQNKIFSNFLKEHDEEFDECLLEGVPGYNTACLTKDQCNFDLFIFFAR